MKTVSVHDLPAMLAQVLAWAKAGEEVRVLPTAREPATSPAMDTSPEAQPFDWSKGVAFNLDRTGWRVMSAEETMEMIHDAQGSW